VLLQTWFATPFLDLFLLPETAPALTERSLQVAAGDREVPAFLVTPDGPNAALLPAVVMASGHEGLTDGLRQFARETASIGYVVLAVDYRGTARPERSALLLEVLGRMNALGDVVAWLSAQPEVDPARMGAVAWNDAFADARELADAGRLAGVFPAAIESQAGMTEQLWVEVYEYLDMHVEDAPSRSSATPAPQSLQVIDIMRALNSEQGVRGRLARSIAAPRLGDVEWKQARSDAALMAEGSTLLLAHRPARGSIEGWQRRAADLRRATEALVRAIDARDLTAARERMRELPPVCAACHADHR
jgi:hypothetical protein